MNTIVKPAANAPQSAAVTTASLVVNVHSADGLNPKAQRANVGTLHRVNEARDRMVDRVGNSSPASERRNHKHGTDDVCGSKGSGRY